MIVSFAGASLLGSLTGNVPVLACILGAAFAAAAVIVAAAMRLGPPREFFPIMLFCISAAAPLPFQAALDRGGWIVAGSFWAAAVAFTPAVWRRGTTAADETRDAVGAIAEFLVALGSSEAGRRRHAAIAAVDLAVASANDTGGRRGPAARHRAGQVEQLLQAALALSFEGTESVDPTLLEALAALSAGDAVDLDEVVVPDAPSTPRLVAALSALAASTGPDWGPPVVVSPAVVPSEGTVAADERGDDGRRTWVAVPWWLTHRNPRRRAAVRSAAAIGLGLGIGFGVGFEQPGWIAVSAVAVLQGATASVVWRRAAQRVVGTTVGFALAGALLALDPSLWTVAVVIIVLQMVVESVIVTSYGLAMVFVTPLTLLLVTLSLGTERSSELVPVRLVDTLVGSALAIAILFVTRSRTLTGRLGRQQALVMAAIGAVFTEIIDPSSDTATLVPTRRHLRSSLMGMRLAADEALGDALWRSPEADARWPITASLERLAALALAVPPEVVASALDEATTPPPRRADLEEMFAALTARTALFGGEQVDAEVPVSVLPGMPRSSAALVDLADTLAGH